MQRAKPVKLSIVGTLHGHDMRFYVLTARQFREVDGDDPHGCVIRMRARSFATVKRAMRHIAEAGGELDRECYGPAY